MVIISYSRRNASAVVLITIGFLFSIFSTCLAQSRDQWNAQAQETLAVIKKLQPNYNVAKNVVFFLGDGMGPTTVTAGRIYRGQRQGRRGEDDDLSFDVFPNVALAKTYTVDKMVPDSAATATAFLSGVKARGYTLGLDSSAYYKNCSTQAGAEVDSILQWSLQQGKSVGIVTTTRVTHATPAAAYAHTVSRYWEVDGDISREEREAGCSDIALQFLENAADVQVVLGGGRRTFLPKPNSTHATGTGEREDGRDLIQEWKQKQEDLGRRHQYIQTAEELEDIDPDQTDYLLGLFEDSHLPYDIDIEEGRDSGPRLQNLTRKAIEILSRNDKGFFLLVEGGRIDHGHHGARAKRALGDVIALHDAVQTAGDMTDDEETLTVVTADHSHVFTMGSYTSRGVDILGLSDNSEGLDGLPVTTILYGNGPGTAYGNQTRQNLTGFDSHDDPTYRYQGAAAYDSESHGGEDVAIYAKGPMAHLFRGVREQNYIAHAMAYASCVGANKDHCLYGCEQYGACAVSKAAFKSFGCGWIVPLVVLLLFGGDY